MTSFNPNNALRKMYDHLTAQKDKHRQLLCPAQGTDEGRGRAGAPTCQLHPRSVWLERLALRHILEGVASVCRGHFGESGLQCMQTNSPTRWYGPGVTDNPEAFLGKLRKGSSPPGELRGVNSVCPQGHLPLPAEGSWIPVGRYWISAVALSRPTPRS